MRKFLYILAFSFVMPSVCLAASQKLGLMEDQGISVVKEPINKGIDLCEKLNCPPTAPCMPFSAIRAAATYGHSSFRHSCWPFLRR